MIKHILPLAALTALTGCTDIPLSGSVFDAITMGNTYSIQRGANPVYGIIQFGANRQVMWHNFEEDACFAGSWTEPQPGLICYSYTGPDRTVCWENTQMGDQITLYLDGDTDREEPYYYGQIDAAATSCPAPGAG